MLKPKVVDGQIWIEELDEWVTPKEYIQSIESTLDDELGEGFKTPEYSIKYTSCSDHLGYRWKEPYLKVYSQQAAETIVDKLTDVGFFAETFLYEDDDGWPGQTRKIWSVELGLKLEKAE